MSFPHNFMNEIEKNQHIGRKWQIFLLSLEDSPCVTFSSSSNGPCVKWTHVSIIRAIAWLLPCLFPRNEEVISSNLHKSRQQTIFPVAFRKLYGSDCTIVNQQHFPVNESRQNFSLTVSDARHPLSVTLRQNSNLKVWETPLWAPLIDN